LKIPEAIGDSLENKPSAQAMREKEASPVIFVPALLAEAISQAG